MIFVIISYLFVISLSLWESRLGENAVNEQCKEY